MSDEMAKKKQMEIDEMAKSSMGADFDAIINDKCPACGSPTTDLLYISAQIVQMFGWVECTNCGCVYSPQSVRKQKLAMGQNQSASNIILPK